MNYGLDAPPVVAGFYLSALTAFFAFLVILFAPFQMNALMLIGALVFLFISLYMLVNGSMMVYSSKVGKIRLTQTVIKTLNLKGDETILDVGCGRGLYAIEIAKTLKSKRAVGIDKELIEDRKEKALNNAKRAGVQLELIERDMRHMPFNENAFEVVVSSMAVHQVSGKEERAKAIREMARVTSHYLILVDFCKMQKYQDVLQELGWKEITVTRPYLRTFPPLRVLYAKKPQV